MGVEGTRCEECGVRRVWGVEGIKCGEYGMQRVWGAEATAV